MPVTYLGCYTPSCVCVSSGQSGGVFHSRSPCGSESRPCFQCNHTPNKASPQKVTYCGLLPSYRWVPPLMGSKTVLIDLEIFCIWHFIFYICSSCYYCTTVHDGQSSLIDSITCTKIRLPELLTWVKCNLILRSAVSGTHPSGTKQNTMLEST